MADPGRGRVRRSYRPGVEGLEALRLLAGAAALPIDLPAAVEPWGIPTGPEVADGGDAWDAALLGTDLADLIGPATAPDSGPATIDVGAIGPGLSQLDRYLSRAWYRGGIAPQKHDDCTQAVYATLLQSLGRNRFDRLTSEIGQVGIRDVLSRETAEGPDFFRAIDTVKKRAQRERAFQPIDAVDVADPGPDAEDSGDWRGALREAIDRSLNPREADLIRATLRGETPAEIAQSWGLAPKTISNEKSRAFQKLRDALSADLAD